ncbi:MAG: hypothetical protein OXF43_08415 [Gammaproteobacteria bacterium]|nr:hypothetical protein [Gammaproteobacteria bacterium]
MNEVTCPGLPASWVNSWLAAVGATVIDPRIRLRWTGDGNLAVLSADGLDPVEALTESWPEERFVSELPISSQWGKTKNMERKIPVEVFRDRARAARGSPQSWTLSSTVTDLSVDKNGEVAHAPFDPPGPGTVKWLHHRLQKIHGAVPNPSTERIKDSLMGKAPRIKNNGLGFDLARLGSGADESDKWIDPILEVLAFFGLALFPMRGEGADARQPMAGFDAGRQRGWRRPAAGGPRLFHWPAWGQPLGMEGIDALLDTWKPSKTQNWDLLSVHAAWKSTAFKTSSTSDPTRAYGSERI